MRRITKSGLTSSPSLSSIHITAAVIAAASSSSSDCAGAEYGAANGGALMLARNGYFDNVIEPNLTRQYLLAALLAHVE